MKRRMNLKTLTIIALVLGFFFAPVFGSVNAMSYNYDFWKNIIPSAEGIAHQDTYYGESFEYYKNSQYEETVEKLSSILNGALLGDIKDVVLKTPYADITADDYNNAKLAVDALELSQSQKDEIKQLIDAKQEFEADTNLYKKINFNKITDIQVYEDKVYVLTTPGAMTFTNITGTSSIADATQLIIINNDMKWEQCISEFAITESVRDQLDSYYQWNRLSFQSVAAGDNHTVAVDKSGNLWAWGNNDKGQLGLNPEETSCAAEPTQITWIGDATSVKYTSVYATGNTTFAIDSTGKLWAWGQNSYNLVSSDSTIEYTHTPQNLLKDAVKSFAVAYDHAFAIGTNNKVYAWGKNNNNLLQNSASLVKTPTDTGIALKKTDTTDKNNPREISLNPVTIYTGKEHAIIVDDSGFLWTWGNNTQGQLGLGHNDAVTSPTEVVLKKNNVTVKVEHASVGDYHTIVVDQLGGLWSYGSNSHYQLGFKELNGVEIYSLNTPYAFEHDVEYTKVYAFGNSSYAVDMDSIGYLFGQNDKYQLGIESENDTVLYQVSSNSMSYTFVTGTKDAAYVLDSEGRLWISGTSDTKLGFGNTDDLKTPKYSEKKLELKNISIATL